MIFQQFIKIFSDRKKQFIFLRKLAFNSGHCQYYDDYDTNYDGYDDNLDD